MTERIEPLIVRSSDYAGSISVRGPTNIPTKNSQNGLGSSTTCAYSVEKGHSNSNANFYILAIIFPLGRSIECVNEREREERQHLRSIMTGTAIHQMRNLNTTTFGLMVSMPSSSSASIGASSTSSASSNNHRVSRHPNNKAYKIPLEEALLPLDFTPGPYTVICGRGRKVQESVGNRRLAVLAQLFIPQYAKATRKDEKSTIVSQIVRMVQDASQEPTRAFVRQANNDRWCQVDNLHAREKVGTVLRDLLSEKYKSSTKSKLVRRKERRQQQEKKSNIPITRRTPSRLSSSSMTMGFSLADFVQTDSESVL